MGRVLATQSKLLERPNLAAADGPSNERADDEFRKILLKAQVLEGVCGSSYVEMGNTKVICSINGPKESNSDSQEGNINVAVTGIDQCARLTIRSALNSVVCLKKIARAEIDVELSILADDGGAIAASLMAASVALTSANIECFDVILACHFLLRDDGSCVLDPDAKRIAQEREAIRKRRKAAAKAVEGTSSSAMDVDPTPSSSGTATTTDGPRSALSVTMAIAPSLGQIVSLDASGGSVDKNTLSKAIRYGFDKCLEIYPIMSKVLHNHASKLL